MSDVSAPLKPLLHPVLALRMLPARKEAGVGGKEEKHIIKSRLAAQRRNLATQVAKLHESQRVLNVFGGHILLVVEMFRDSQAVTFCPRDLFRVRGEFLTRGATKNGYVIEIDVDDLPIIERRIKLGDAISVRCDISRVRAIRPYGLVDILRSRTLDALWKQAPKHERGRAFNIWLAPFREVAAREEILEHVEKMRREEMVLPTSPRMLLGPIAHGDIALPDSADRQSSVSILQREYRTVGHGHTVVQITTPLSLSKIISSGVVYRIEPVRPLLITSPGEGEEPKALPAFIATQPIVGIVDGGCTARRYSIAEAWRATPFIRDGHADAKHGNQVTSVVVHGHEWNNNLPLPELYCRVGIAQAIARSDARVIHNPARLVSYIDSIVGEHPETRVWNLSWNERKATDVTYVSALGHDLSLLARKHNILFVISAGNVQGTQGDCVAAPADCEASLVVGGRQFDLMGKPSLKCPESLPGYGPEFQLVPHVTSYSPLRILGGVVSRGTSFSTGLLSSLAAHTFDNLREPTPDLVRALIINSADLPSYDPGLGWGTPCNVNMPWNCAPGTVTLAFKSQLRAGILYYWSDIPIPRELMRGGKLHGSVSLTTVHHPLCNAEGGPSYIATRVAAALQYPNLRGKFDRLVGSKEIDDTAELKARSEEYKWQPLRCDRRRFRGLGFNGSMFRVYARLFARNIQQFGLRVNADLPPIETVFVLTFSDGTGTSDLYNSMVVSLGNFVESAVLNQEIEIE